MKKIFLILIFSSFSYFIEAQNIDGSYWCIHSMNAYIDTNGQKYMLLNLYNNDPGMDSNSSASFIRIEGILSGPDTIKPISYFNNYDNLAIIDTIQVYKLDTSIATASISGFIIRRVAPSCGLILMESTTLNKSCEGNSSLGILENEENSFIVYPNPAQSVLIIDAKQRRILKSIVLKNIFGQTVFASKYNNTQTEQIDISRFARGIYLITINNTISKKIKIE